LILSRNDEIKIELKGFNYAVNADAVGHQKAMLRGGACKVADYFCPYCPTHSHDCYVPNDERCARWCEELYDEYDTCVCYHHDMSNRATIDDVTSSFDLVQAMVGDMMEYLHESEMSIGNPEVTTDAQTIEFVPQTVSERITYMSTLRKELTLRSLPTTGTLDQLKVQLRLHLEGEQELQALQAKLDHCTPDENALYKLLLAIPCILHMENRIGIKLVEMVLIEGGSNAIAGKLFGHIRGKVGKARFEHFAASIEEHVNNEILGDDNNPGQWRFPISDKDGTSVANLRMHNPHTRKFVKNFHSLVDCCVVEEERRGKWKEIVEHHRQAMKLVTKHEDLTDAEIVEYQRLADKFFKAYVELLGRDGMTNYVHMVGSGHIADFLLRWRSLYRHSQQGWEALNNLIKTFYARRTQRGGTSGTGEDMWKSILRPIALWLQRRVFWLTGGTTEGLNVQKTVNRELTTNESTNKEMNITIHDKFQCKLYLLYS
jgi:hypothetical protein